MSLYQYPPMNNAVRLSATLCLIAVAAVCAGGQNADATSNYDSSKQTITAPNTLNKQATNAIASYAGATPYSGRVDIRMRIPGSSVGEIQDSGASSATLT